MRRCSAMPLGSKRSVVKMPWRDGTTHPMMSPLDFTLRLTAPETGTSSRSCSRRLRYEPTLPIE